MSAHAKRLVYLIHRWTGIVTCVLMALWLVSGIVMLFVGYPKLLPLERLSALPPLPDAGCCIPVSRALAASRDAQAVRGITLTTVAGRPVYRLREGDGGWRVVDARTGDVQASVDVRMALASARAYSPDAEATFEGMVDDDRWTHSGGLDSHRPLFQVQMHDDASTRLYVSSRTGEVVMDATRAERTWNFVGAWLHWLYMFRDGSKDAVWSWLVIVLSAVGTVSTLAGAVVGIWRWRFSDRYKSGARTPYREFQMRWHHITGLVFGLVVLAWIFSGLMSMNPLGVFDAKGERPNAEAYRGASVATMRVGFEARDALQQLASSGFETRELEWRVLAQRPYLLARDGQGGTRLVLSQGATPRVATRFTDAELSAAGARLMTAPVTTWASMDAYDAYYYQRQAASMYGAREHRLPVLRMHFSDLARTQVYLDPHTGDLALSLDRSQRVGRWLFNFLHSWDLAMLLRFEASRDLVLILLSVGGLALATTSVVIGGRRLCKAVSRR